MHRVITYIVAIAARRDIRTKQYMQYFASCMPLANTSDLNLILIQKPKAKMENKYTVLLSSYKSWVRAANWIQNE